MAKKRAAPKFLNLLQIKLPVGGIASIGHRVSGVFMFLVIPLFAYWFGMSLESEAGFLHALRLADSLLFQLVLIVLVWAFSHHLLAGLRHLFLDIHVGIERQPARMSAWLVNLGALLMTAVYVVSLL